MRKIAAILLMLILLFNLCGYRMMINLLQQKEDARLETRLDKNDYNETDLIEMRVALNMPYQERYTEFERHYGEIEINGKSYTYVKRKIEGDVLVLKCIPNKSKQEFTKIKNDWVKANTGEDMDHPGKQSPQKSFAKSFFSEYDDQNLFQSLTGPTPFFNPAFSHTSCLLQKGIANTPYQPPRA